MKLLISIFIWVVTGIATVLVFISVLFLGIFLFPFDKKGSLLHAQGFWWADIIIGINPFWKLKISGLERVDPHKTYVIVANHQSLADIAMIYKTRTQFKWVAKDSLFNIPVFGWCMSLMKYIRLTRGMHGSIRQVYWEAGEWLKRGVSVLFFPEGTRSPTAEVNTFKNGAFKLAIKEQRPVLPIRIEGSGNILPRGSWIFKSKAFCKLTVLPEVDTSKFSPQDFNLLRDTVWKLIKKEKDE